MNDTRKYKVKESSTTNQTEDKGKESAENRHLQHLTLFGKLKFVSYQWGNIEIKDISEKNIESFVDLDKNGIIISNGIN